MKTSLTLVRTVDASPAEVYAAWLEPALMAKWMAPPPLTPVSFETDPRVGGAYKFAVSEPDLPPHVTHGRYLELVPGEKIVKTWIYDGPYAQFAGNESIVTVKLRQLGPHLTEVTIAHEQLATEEAVEQTTGGWTEYLVALRSALRDAGRVYTVKRQIEASPAAVYAAWTEPAIMRTWMATRVEADVRVGGKLFVEIDEQDGSKNAFRGEYLVLDPPKRIVKTFEHQGGNLGHHDEYLVIEIVDLGAGLTELSLTNAWSGLPIDDQTGLAEGWKIWIDQLEQALQRRL